MAYIQQTQQAWATAWQKNPTKNINKVVYHLLTLPNSFKIRINYVHCQLIVLFVCFVLSFCFFFFFNNMTLRGWYSETLTLPIGD